MTTTTGLRALCAAPDDFLATTWTRSPALLAPPPHAPAPLTMERVIGLLTGPLLRLPHVRLVLRGQPVAPGLFTEERRVGHTTLTDCVRPDRVLDYFSRGATVVLDALDLIDPTVHAWCEELADELGHPVGGSAFLTPPGAAGLAPHVDAEDVFCVQVSGTKRWTVHEQLTPVPVTPGPLPADRLGAVAISTELQPGQVLYMPRSVPHHAAAATSHSLHLSFAARRATALELARAGLEAAAAREDSLDVPSGVEGVAAAASLLSAAALAPAPGGDPAPTSSRPGLGEVLGGLDALAEQRLDRVVATVPVTVTVEDDTAVADFAGLRVRFPRVRVAELEQLAAGAAVAPAGLGSGADIAPLVARGVLSAAPAGSGSAAA